MQFNLKAAKFIPQSNVRTSTKLSLDSLLTFQEKPIPVEYDLVYLKTGSWKILDKFVENQQEDEGFTASLVEGSVFLLKTNESLGKELSPKFLNGKGTTFKSDYFTFIVASTGIDLSKTTEFFLEEGESGIDGVKAYLLITEAPVVKKPHSLEPQPLTAEQIANTEQPIPQPVIPVVEHTQEELDAAKEFYSNLNANIGVPEEILPTKNVVFPDELVVDEFELLTETIIVQNKPAIPPVEVAVESEDIF